MSSQPSFLLPGTISYSKVLPNPPDELVNALLKWISTSAPADPVAYADRMNQPVDKSLRDMRAAAELNPESPAAKDWAAVLEVGGQRAKELRPAALAALGSDDLWLVLRRDGLKVRLLLRDSHRTFATALVPATFNNAMQAGLAVFAHFATPTDDQPLC